MSENLKRSLTGPEVIETDAALDGLLLDLYPLTIANGSICAADQRQFAADMASHISSIKGILRLQCNLGKEHLYRVTSPIDSVEICIYCHDERSCAPFCGEGGPALRKDQA